MKESVLREWQKERKAEVREREVCTFLKFFQFFTRYRESEGDLRICSSVGKIIKMRFSANLLNWSIQKLVKNISLKNNICVTLLQKVKKIEVNF